MVELRKITEDNFHAVVDMKMPPEQHFVAPNVLSLAQAWLYPEARPFAVYDGDTDTLVGFSCWTGMRRSARSASGG